MPDLTAANFGKAHEPRAGGRGARPPRPRRRERRAPRRRRSPSLSPSARRRRDARGGGPTSSTPARRSATTRSSSRVLGERDRASSARRPCSSRSASSRAPSARSPACVRRRRGAAAVRDSADGLDDPTPPPRPRGPRRPRHRRLARHRRGDGAAPRPLQRARRDPLREKPGRGRGRRAVTSPGPEARRRRVFQAELESDDGPPPPPPGGRRGPRRPPPPRPQRRHLRAGTRSRRPTTRPSSRRWRTTQAVNLEAAAHLTLLCAPGDARRALRDGSSWSPRAPPSAAETDAASYAVSKAGMVSLARCLARNEGRHGITANSVCPGWVDTAMARPDVAAAQGRDRGGDPARPDRDPRGLRPRDPLLPLAPRLLRERHGPRPQRRLVPPLTSGRAGPERPVPAARERSPRRTADCPSRKTRLGGVTRLRGALVVVLLLSRPPAAALGEPLPSRLPRTRSPLPALPGPSSLPTADSLTESSTS